MDWWPGRVDRELLFHGVKVQFGKMRTFWRWVVRTVAQLCECT